MVDSCFRLPLFLFSFSDLYSLLLYLICGMQVMSGTTVEQLGLFIVDAYSMEHVMTTL